MILKIYPFDEIDFAENYINVLEIRDTKLFYNISRSFVMYCDDLEGVENIKLFDKGVELSISKKVFVINNIFDININDKKIINKLYSIVSTEFCEDSEKVVRVGEIYDKLISEFIDVFNSFDIELEYSLDFSIKSYLKMIGLEFYEERVDFLKNLYSFIDIIVEFDLYKVVVLNNIKAYIADEELAEFYKYCVYKKIHLLLIEPKMERDLLKYENKVIIDEDYCDYIEKV